MTGAAAAPNGESHEERFRELLAFVAFSDAEAALLRELVVHARPHFIQLAEQLHARTREHAAAQNVFANDDQIERSLDALVGWLERVLVGPRDTRYAAQATHIGRMHVRLGLPQRYLHGAMTMFRSELMAIAFANMPGRALAVCQALGKVLDAELAILCLAYSEAERTRRERLEQPEPDRVELARMRLALDVIDDVVIGLDDQQRIVTFNQRASLLTGYSLEEVVGQPVEVLLLDAPEDDALSMALDRAALLSAGDSLSLQHISIATRRGTERRFDGRVMRRVAEDECAYTFVVGRDVTRSIALDARLRRSEKQAAIGTLAAGLAHEIRNPLNGAQLHVTFIQRGLQTMEGTHELVAAATVVSDELRRLGDLVSEFLDFARPHALQRTLVALQPVASRCVELLREAAAHAAVSISCDLPPTPIEAEIDVDRIEQVLLNLLQNGIEAAGERPEGEGRVRLELSRRHRSAVFLVADNGPGMSMDSAIWDAFYSTKANGTGLGLAIVHRIVSDHGGAVTVESAPGDTKFWVDLPLIDPEKLPTSVRPGRPTESS